MVFWKRNLFVITAAELIAVAGFSVITPFLPFYVQELGITDPDQVKLWSGWLNSIPAVSMAFVAPIWGVLADRHGRKMMVERAMFGGALVFLMMGFARSAPALLALRALQGLVTGTVPAATALVASTTPRDCSGSSMGTLQTGIYLGASFGPLLGGVVADLLGYRAAFWVTGMLLGLAGVAVHWMVDERHANPEQLAGRTDGHMWDGLVSVLRSRVLWAVLAVQLVARLGVRVVSPLMPLFVQELAPAADRLATLAGAVAGAGAVASAGGAALLGRKSDQVGHRKMLLLCSVGMVMFYLPQVAVRNTTQLCAGQILTGFLMAGVLASVTALLASLVPEGRQGAVYGVNTTVSAAANALGPTLGAAVAVCLGLRPLFVVAAACFAVGGAVAHWLVPRPGRLQHQPKGV